VAAGRDEVGELIRDLGHIPGDAQRYVRPAILRAGSDVLHRARANASWSTRIPAATRLSVRFSRNPGVDVITDGRRAPHAAVYENEGKPGRLAHPLFGNRSHWYRFAARPYLGPAMDAEAPHAVAAIADAVDRALWNAEFR
jgi:hypothetical protein